MTLLEIEEQRLFDKNIILKKHFLPPKKPAMCASFQFDSTIPKLIIYDNNQLPTKQHLRTAILHEEMHLDHVETMYGLDDCLDMMKRKEKKVDRLIIKKYIPMQTLFDLLYIHHLQKYEIAEELCLTEELIENAFNYYSNLESWHKKIVQYNDSNNI